MALSKCPECGSQVSDRAVQCPHCGCPFEPAKPEYPNTGKFKVALLAIGVVLAVIVLSKNSNEGKAPEPPGATTQTAKPSRPESAQGPAVPPLNVHQATAKQIEYIQYMIESGGGHINHGCQTTRGWSLKSSSHANSQYVAAYLDCPGLEDQKTIGVWLVSGSRTEPSGMVLSVDATAEAFSAAPNGSSTKAATSSADPEVRALKRYARGH